MFLGAGLLSDRMANLFVILAAFCLIITVKLSLRFNICIGKNQKAEQCYQLNKNREVIKELKQSVVSIFIIQILILVWWADP